MGLFVRLAFSVCSCQFLSGASLRAAQWRKSVGKMACMQRFVPYWRACFTKDTVLPCTYYCVIRLVLNARQLQPWLHVQAGNAGHAPALSGYAAAAIEIIQNNS